VWEQHWNFNSITSLCNTSSYIQTFIHLVNLQIHANLFSYFTPHPDFVFHQLYRSFKWLLQALLINDNYTSIFFTWIRDQRTNKSCWKELVSPWLKLLWKVVIFLPSRAWSLISHTLVVFIEDFNIVFWANCSFKIQDIIFIFSTCKTVVLSAFFTSCLLLSSYTTCVFFTEHCNLLPCFLVIVLQSSGTCIGYKETQPAWVF